MRQLTLSDVAAKAEQVLMNGFFVRQACHLPCLDVFCLTWLELSYSLARDLSEAPKVPLIRMQ